MSFRVPNQFRVRTGLMASSDMAGNCGLFFVPLVKRGEAPLRCIAHDGLLEADEDPALGGWEHVSVSLPNRCPTWAEMDRIKSLFWEDDDTVLQLHPPRRVWVNLHPYCLHLWRPIGVAILLPPVALIGPVTGHAQ
jgi:hypothetical protein